MKEQTVRYNHLATFEFCRGALEAGPDTHRITGPSLTIEERDGRRLLRWHFCLQHLPPELEGHPLIPTAASAQEPTLSWDGDTWRVIGRGAERNGTIYCHLASTTRYRTQKNGNVPLQIGDWIPIALLDAAGGAS